MAMTNVALRAKFRVTSVRRNIDEKGDTSSEEVALSAVYGKDGSDNAQWSKWTPFGELKMTISNPSAYGALSSGHEFYLDFTPAE